MDIRQNGVLGKAAPSGTQPWAFTVHTVSLFLFLAFIKRVRAKPLGKGNCLWVLATYSLKSQGIAKLWPFTPILLTVPRQSRQSFAGRGELGRGHKRASPYCSHSQSHHTGYGPRCCSPAALHEGVSGPKGHPYSPPTSGLALSMAHLILGLPESLPNLQVRITSPISQCTVLIPVKKPITQHCNCRWADLSPHSPFPKRSRISEGGKGISFPLLFLLLGFSVGTQMGTPAVEEGMLE